MALQTSFRPFGDIIMQYRLGYIYCFQEGNSVPATPALFQSNLQAEAKMFAAVFPGTPITAGEVAEMNALIQQYQGFYLKLLSDPEPSNPSPEYDAWYQSTHNG